MVATKKKNIVFALLLMLMFAIIMNFAVPLEAFAAPTSGTSGNNQIPGVSIQPDGTINIKGAGFDQAKGGNAWGQIIGKYRTFIAGVSGIAAITMVVIFIFQFLKLGASAGNPQARSQALVGCLWSGIAAAGLGAVTLIVGLFYHAL